MRAPQSLFGGRFQNNDLMLSSETVKFQFHLKPRVFGLLTF